MGIPLIFRAPLALSCQTLNSLLRAARLHARGYFGG
jgi:hypothetical protein